MMKEIDCTECLSFRLEQSKKPKDILHRTTSVFLYKHQIMKLNQGLPQSMTFFTLDGDFGIVCITAIYSACLRQGEQLNLSFGEQAQIELNVNLHAKLVLATNIAVTCCNQLQKPGVQELQILLVMVASKTGPGSHTAFLH